MRLADIAFRNLKVRWTRTLFLVCGMALGVATVVALAALTGALRAQLRADLESAGARVVVAPQAERLSLSYRGVAVASALSFSAPNLPPDTLARIGRLAERFRIGVVAPKLVRAQRIGVDQWPVVGVDFAAEKRLNPHWEVTGRMPSGPREVLLGHRAAQGLKALPGGILTLAGQEYTVAGILAETGSQEDPAVFMPLSSLAEMVGRRDSVSLVELVVARNAVPEVVSALRQALPGTRVTAVKGEEEARREVVERFARASALTTLLVVVFGALIIGTAMMASVRERTREIGIFRAIGYRQTHIRRIILTEAMVVSAAGGALGYLAGMVAALGAGPLIAGTTVRVVWDPLGAVAAVGFALLVGLGAGLYPALKAARLDPATALRFV